MWSSRTPLPSSTSNSSPIRAHKQVISVKVNSYPRESKSSIHFSSTLAGVSQNSLAQLAEQNKSRTSAPCWCDLVNTYIWYVASNYSTYWPIYGLKKNLYGFTVDRSNPYANNAFPRNTNSSHTSQTTQVAPRTRKPASPMCSLCWCGHVDTCVVLWISVCSWFYRSMVLLPTRTYYNGMVWRYY